MSQLLQTPSDSTPLAPRDRTNNVSGLSVICWGTRGSVPSPGPATVGFGGNTSCVEVRSPTGHLYILDGGTGIRPLGEALRAAPDPVEADLFLSHFHWDHVQGIPFFSPLYDARTRLRVHGPGVDDAEIRSRFAYQLVEDHFPVAIESIPSALRFRAVGSDPLVIHGVEISAFRARHAGHTLGYRLRCGSSSVAFFPDNELGPADPAAHGWYADLVGFLDGVDLLIHDAMYTEGEYERRRGWGHSTHGQAVRLAERAAVKRLVLFHHAPERSDPELRAILHALRGDLRRRGSPLQVDMATEGQTLWAQREAQ